MNQQAAYSGHPTTSSDPGFASASHSAALAKALQAQLAGKLEDAELAYREILACMPDHPTAMHFLGVTLHQLGRSEEGLALVQASLAHPPGHGDWHNTLGNMLVQLGRHEEAVPAFLEAVEAEPHHAVAWNNLGAVLLRQGHLNEAKSALANAVALNPQFKDALLNLGEAHTQAGEPHEAALCYCAEYVLRPPQATQPHMLGIAFSQLGRTQDAVRVYEQWLLAEPANPVARHLLEACKGALSEDRASPDYVQAYFDQFADTFESKLLGNLGYRVPARLSALLQTMGLKPGNTLQVLDAGCGTGLCGEILKPYASTLTGVDLSAKCLEKAHAKHVYDSLEHKDIVEYLSAYQPAALDLVVAADTLIYFGDLRPILAGAAQALMPGGWLVASLEEWRPETSAAEEVRIGYHLHAAGRYSHHRSYVLELLHACGFMVRHVEALDIRSELARPVPGLLIAAQRAR